MPVFNFNIETNSLKESNASVFAWSEHEFGGPAQKESGADTIAVPAPPS